MHSASSVAYVTKRKSALPDAKRDPEVGQLNSPWPTYGGRPTTLWVYLVPFGRYTWERACLKTAKFFSLIFFDHVTKPMVWGHSGGMGHTGTYFCFP